MWLDYKGKRHFLPTEMPEEPFNIRVTRITGNNIRNRLQDLHDIDIAIDLMQIIEITDTHQQNRKLIFIALGPQEFLIQLLEKALCIIKPCRGVERNQFFQFLAALRCPIVRSNNLRQPACQKAGYRKEEKPAHITKVHLGDPMHHHRLINHVAAINEGHRNCRNQSGLQADIIAQDHDKHHAGNRHDADFQALAEVAAAARPDRIWLKDIGGSYLRGRASGDVAQILRGALVADGMPEDALPVCLDEALAAQAALAWAKPGDLLLLLLHEPARRDAVLALLARLQTEGWQAGQPVPLPEGAGGAAALV